MRGFFISFKVYILQSTRRDRFYIGHTGDELSERIRKHNTTHKGCTAKYRTGNWFRLKNIKPKRRYMVGKEK
jgi:hypothetical protein